MKKHFSAFNRTVLGHYIEASVVPFVFGQVALIAAAALWESTALLAVSASILVIYGAAAVAWWPKHYRGLCELCFAAFPLNAPEEATRLHRWLRMTHIVDDGARWLMRTLRVPSTVAAQMTAASVIGAVVTFLLVLVSLWLAAPFIVGAAVALRAALLHQRFGPWCPWCRRGHGDDESSPAPEPDPVVSQTL